MRAVLARVAAATSADTGPDRGAGIEAATGGTAAGPGDAAIDAALLARVAAADRAAFAELYDRFAGRVYSLLRRLCGTPDAADNAFQAVFLAIWRGAGWFDPTRGSPATWVLTVAYHTAVDWLRREATVRRHVRPISEDGRELPSEPGAEHTALDTVVAAQVRDALAELSPTQRQVIALAYYGGHTQSEVAAMLDIPPRWRSCAST